MLAIELAKMPTIDHLFAPTCAGCFRRSELRVLATEIAESGKRPAQPLPRTSIMLRHSALGAPGFTKAAITAPVSVQPSTRSSTIATV